METADKLFHDINTPQKCNKVFVFLSFVIVLKFVVGKRSESDAVCGQ